MRQRAALALALAALLAAVPAAADDVYGGAVRAPEFVDAGFHTPVLTKAPQLLQGVEPTFPEEAKAEKLTGDVTMQVDIGADGKVAGVTVLQGAGHGFDEAAVEAVKQFVFSPAEIDNVPAPVRIQYTHHFVYREPPPDTPPPEVADGGPPPKPELPISLKGHLLERGSRKPVVGATVKASGQDEDVTSEAGGAFALRLPPGKVTLTVLDANHQLYQTEETIKPGEALDVTYYLMPKVVGLYETVVRSEREKKEVTRYTLEREELQKVPGSFGDPLRVLHDLPGVARSAFGLGNLVVRGAAPNDTGYYVDGVRLPLLYHFGAGPSVVNSEFLDRIDFYPGGFGSEYGRAIGGVVDVKTRSAKENEWHGSGKIDLIDTGVYLSAPIIEGLSVSVAARRSYIDAILRVALPIVTNSGVLVAPSYYDYQARVDYKPPTLPGHSFTLFFMGSDDLLTVAQTGGDTSNPFQVNVHQGFQRLVGTWAWKHGPLTLTTQPFVGADENSTGIGEAQIDTPTKSLGLREKLELRLDEFTAARAGIDSQIQQTTLTTQTASGGAGAFGDGGPATLTPSSSERDLYEYAEWAELELGTRFGLKVVPSLRADHFKAGLRWFSELDPRLSVRQTLGEYLPTLKASVGQYSELPPTQALTGRNQSLDLPLQHALQTSAGVEQRITDAIHLDLTAFYNRRYDLAESSRFSAGPTAPGRGIPGGVAGPGGLIGDFGGAGGGGRGPALLPTGKGRAYGLELLLKHELTKHFFGWIAYTLSWSDEDEAPGIGFHPSSSDQRHILIAIGQYKFGNGWELGGRFQLTSGTPTTAIVDNTLQADTGNYTPVNGETNGARLPTFHQLDLRVDKTWLFDRWQLGVYLDVQNVYNHQNQEFVIYDYRYQTTQVVPGIPFFPTLGVKGSF